MPYRIKKASGEPGPIVLTETPDVLTEISRDRPRRGQVIVGFAAETGDAVANGRDKLARKGCDLLVVNEVGERAGFEAPDNAAVVLDADGSATEVPYGPKEDLADVVWDQVAARLT